MSLEFTRRPSSFLVFCLYKLFPLFFSFPFQRQRQTKTRSSHPLAHSQNASRGWDQGATAWGRHQVPGAPRPLRVHTTESRTQKQSRDLNPDIPRENVGASLLNANTHSHEFPGRGQSALGRGTGRVPIGGLGRVSGCSPCHCLLPTCPGRTGTVKGGFRLPQASLCRRLVSALSH